MGRFAAFPLRGEEKEPAEHVRGHPRGDGRRGAGRCGRRGGGHAHGGSVRGVRERREGEMRARETRAGVQIAQLRPWLAFDIPAEKLTPTRDTVQFAGTVSATRMEALEGAFAPLAARLQVVGTNGDEACVWAIAHRDDAKAAQEAPCRRRISRPRSSPAPMARPLSSAKRWKTN